MTLIMSHNYIYIHILLFCLYWCTLPTHSRCRMAMFLKAFDRTKCFLGAEGEARRLRRRVALKTFLADGIRARDAVLTSASTSATGTTDARTGCSASAGASSGADGTTGTAGTSPGLDYVAGSDSGAGLSDQRSSDRDILHKCNQNGLSESSDYSYKSSGYGIRSGEAGEEEDEQLLEMITDIGRRVFDL